MVRHIGRALKALHEKGILHLDVKPENEKEIVGTAGYIAPEVLTVLLG